MLAGTRPELGRLFPSSGTIRDFTETLFLARTCPVQRDATGAIAWPVPVMISSHPIIPGPQPRFIQCGSGNGVLILMSVERGWPDKNRAGRGSPARK